MTPSNTNQATSQAKNAIVWFRRDLRVLDNGALIAAISHVHSTGGMLIPMFVLDPKLLKPASPNRLGFLFAALRSLRESGLPIRVTPGDPVQVIARAANDLNADVYVTADAGPYGRLRDAAVRNAMRTAMPGGAELIEADSPYLVQPGTVRKGDDTPYKVFTPFSRVWLTFAQDQRSAQQLGADVALSKNAIAMFGGTAELGEIPAAPAAMSAELPMASEQAAHAAAQKFLAERMHAYGETRNDPGADATSRLGAYLKYGLLHPRQLMHEVQQSVGQGSEGAKVFRSELCWREFYADVLWHRPESARENYVPNMAIESDSGTIADQRFQAWCDGKTGFPFIDAGMRQLVAEGWMHNRVRMAVASFLVKDLHLDWQRGASWFMRHLVDGDLASNQHGWQWTAGTGTDASPYFRVFNPISQGKKFDPDGIYVRRWIPELADTPKKFIQEPWLMPAAGNLFDGASTQLGYPNPIVDHAAEREESLRRYGLTRP
jgi:deoxyribodipyrimidine photo-lyase